MSLQILLVAGHHEARRTLRDLLEVWGYEVCDAMSGKAALAAAAIVQPHVAIIDLELPGSFDGYALGRALHETPEQPMLVAYASRATAFHRHRALDAGFAFVLAKPGGIDELQTMLAVAEKRTLRRVK